MLEYIVGLSAMVGFIGYVYLFIVGWKKFCKDDLLDTEHGLIGAVILSVIVPLGFFIVLLVPFLIGRTIVG
jgi:hypothetical protein